MNFPLLRPIAMNVAPIKALHQQSSPCTTASPTTASLSSSSSPAMLLSLRIKLMIATVLSLTLTVSLAHLTISLWQSWGAHEVNEWLDQHQLGGYKALFREHGKSAELCKYFSVKLRNGSLPGNATVISCGSVECDWGVI